MEKADTHDPLAVWTVPTVSSLEQAVCLTLSYADIFSYPLTLAELHRYLIAAPCSREELADVLRRINPANLGIAARDGYYTLAGRESLVTLRQHREEIAIRMWPRALRYGQAIAQLPFVRMVALTGALTVHNVEAGDDYDYLIIAASGRVWLTRLLIIQSIVRPAARRGDEVCPNYILAEHALRLEDEDLFHAHELAQMLPLYGLPVYEQLRAANPWATLFLPNASGPPSLGGVMPVSRTTRRTLPELVLRSAAGDWLERREMERMRHKLDPHGDRSEVSLQPDRCKGHLGAHGHSTHDAFAARVQSKG